MVNQDTGQTELSTFGQELLKQNLQNGYIPNSGIGGVLSQMFQAYLSGAQANPGSTLSMFGGQTVDTGQPGATPGTMEY